MPELGLQQLLALLETAGVNRLYGKFLRQNNNSKQQFYIARGDWSALQMLPMGEISQHVAAGSPGNPTAQHRDNYKANLDFSWLNDDGHEFVAPSAQLILYPKYPEIRIGSLIQGAMWSPKELLMQQQSGRILFLGIHPENRIIGYMAAHTSRIAKEYLATVEPSADGVLAELILPGIGNNRQRLLTELRRIHSLGWIRSKKLLANTTVASCEASQCVGYTLEAELKIVPNSKAEPDYLGWEVKAHTVPSFTSDPTGKSISLFTPEPDGGFYADYGLLEFLKRFGYPDTQGRVDRLNFGGVHRANVPVDNRNKGGVVSTLRVKGYDRQLDSFTDLDDCGLELVSGEGVVLAKWSYPKLLTRWQKKHKNAVYVPGMVRDDPLCYYYGNVCRLGMSTSIKLFFRAVTDGHVLYDPAPKVENLSTNPKWKARTQFRVASRSLPFLYERFQVVSLIDGTTLNDLSHSQQ